MSGVATALSGLAKRGLALVYPEVCQLCRDEPLTAGGRLRRHGLSREDETNRDAVLPPLRPAV